MHALEIVHSLLEEDGLLIDIHPSDEPSPIEVVHGNRRALAGYVQESDDFIEYNQVDEALAKSIAMGLFDLERKGLFEFITRAATLADLLTYLEESWSDAIVAPEVQRRAAELLASGHNGGDHGKPQLMITEQVRILRLRSICKS